MRAWEAVQTSLDVYVQRISVAENVQKSSMRAWYESIQDIGGIYYGNGNGNVHNNGIGNNGNGNIFSLQ